MKRRRFLNFLLTGLGFTALGSFIYPLLRFLAPAGAKAKIKPIVLKKSEIPMGEAKDIALDGAPAMIINRAGRGFVAFSRICTHLGCLVEFDRAQNKIICPCHGAIFDLEGNVLSGPPPRPLPRFALKIEGESIVIG